MLLLLLLYMVEWVIMRNEKTTDMTSMWLEFDIVFTIKKIETKLFYCFHCIIQ